MHWNMNVNLFAFKKLIQKLLAKTYGILKQHIRVVLGFKYGYSPNVDTHKYIILKVFSFVYIFYIHTYSATQKLTYTYYICIIRTLETIRCKEFIFSILSTYYVFVKSTKNKTQTLGA